MGGRRGSHPASLWLWRRLAAAALIQPLAWEPPHAAGAALKSQKKKKSTKEAMLGPIRQAQEGVFVVP